MQRDHPALLVIDMQQCMARPDAGARNNPQAEANIDLLLEEATADILAQLD